MSDALIIVGAGGHAAVLADALLAAGKEVLGFMDVDASRHGSLLCGLPILGDDSVLNKHVPAKLQLVNGIGGTWGEPLRRTLQHGFEAKGWRFAEVRHPRAVVSRFAEVAGDAQLLAACVVQAGAVVGRGCIVNTAAVVEHDVVLGEFVHVACNATLCGNVRVGANSHIGAAAVLRQGVRVGDGTLIAAGAVVVRNCEGSATLMGVPARVVEGAAS